MAEGTLDSVTVSMNWNETPDVVPANLSLSLIAPDGTTTKLGGPKLGGPQVDYIITTELTSPAPTYPLDQGLLSTVSNCDDCTEVLQLGFAFPFYEDSGQRDYRFIQWTGIHGRRPRTAAAAAQGGAYPAVKGLRFTWPTQTFTPEPMAM